MLIKERDNNGTRKRKPLGQKLFNMIPFGHIPQ